MMVQQNRSDWSRKEFESDSFRRLSSILEDPRQSVEIGLPCRSPVEILGGCRGKTPSETCSHTHSPTLC